MLAAVVVPVVLLVGGAAGVPDRPLKRTDPVHRLAAGHSLSLSASAAVTASPRIR